MLSAIRRLSTATPSSAVFRVARRTVILHSRPEAPKMLPKPQDSRLMTWTTIMCAGFLLLGVNNILLRKSPKLTEDELEDYAEERQAQEAAQKQ
jgi:hypothetical protein